MSGFNPYEGLQELVAQVPEFVQPFIVALAGAIPYIEGEGSAALGVFAGINPIVAGISGAVGNIICVVLVVTLSARVRAAALARRARRADVVVGAGVGGAGVDGPAAEGPVVDAPATEDSDDKAKPSKGRQRLRRWIVRFGVPGASLLGPLALPTQLTAATLVASGVSKSWVILWQVIAIVVWTTAVTAASAGLLTAVTGGAPG